jgi:hypothetical protein
MAKQVKHRVLFLSRMWTSPSGEHDLQCDLSGTACAVIMERGFDRCTHSRRWDEEPH